MSRRDAWPSDRPRIVAMSVAELYALPPVPKPPGDAVTRAQAARAHLTDAEVWALCVRREPDLAALERAAGWFRGGPGFCANGVWYRVLKPVLCGLVGWTRAPRMAVEGRDRDEEDFLHGTRAYDVCYQRIYAALPDCEHDGLCGMRPPPRRRATRRGRS